MSLGKRLKLARGKLTQLAAADAVGLRNTTISRYEQGKIPRPLKYLVFLCRKNRVSPTWLLLGKGPESLADALRPTPLDADLLAEVWEAVQRAYAEAGQTPHVRSLAATAARIYDDLVTLQPAARPARLAEAVAAIKADAGGGA
jgi:transcriptional regulator with XRE-family HTH domain